MTDKYFGDYLKKFLYVNIIVIVLYFILFVIYKKSYLQKSALTTLVSISENITNSKKVSSKLKIAYYFSTISFSNEMQVLGIENNYMLINKSGFYIDNAVDYLDENKYLTLIITEDVTIEKLAQSYKLIIKKFKFKGIYVCTIKMLGQDGEMKYNEILKNPRVMRD